LPREASEAGLSVDAGEDMKSELFWSLDDDVLAGLVPADHVVILGSLEETVRTVEGEISYEGEEKWARTRKVW
jgi:hypothetical protein